MIKYVDMHTHLTNEMYESDIEEVIKSDLENGVEKVLLIGCDEEEIKSCLVLYEKYPDYIYLAFGFHPMVVSDLSMEKIKWLEDIINGNDKVIAVGEIGLDYYWHPEEKELQMYYFNAQLELAKRLKKPVIIHARESYNDCYDLLLKGNYFNGIMHSFADDFEMAKLFLEKGMLISISGPVTFKNGDNQKDVVKNIDINRLLVETDGPYLTPVPFRGKRNESKYLRYIVEEIAAIRNEKLEDVANNLYSNSISFLEENFNESVKS